MIELQDDRLIFSFPEVHEDAALHIEFQRTLRVPDDRLEYPLPAGLGRFPLRHVDDFPRTVPRAWIDHGGVMLPMYQAEAMWINFDCRYAHGHETAYPFAIKIATGKINAVTGKPWRGGINRQPQDYVVAPKQPWLDGYCVKAGTVRQFVAMPLGRGYTAEEQLTGAAEHGGVQISVFPMRREVFLRRFPARPLRTRMLADINLSAVKDEAPMGLAPGGRIRQEIYEDPYGIDDWDLEHTGRCFVHLANSAAWRVITGAAPPPTPITPQAYHRRRVPWFDYYAEEPATPVSGACELAGLKTVSTVAAEKGDPPLEDNASLAIRQVVLLREGLRPTQVRDGTF